METKNRICDLSEQERIELIRSIINLLAEKQCTAQEADNILCSTRISVANSSIVQHLD